jgi:hypothetical protein
MTLLHTMAACGRAAFWWLCLRRWVGGGPGHPSYHHALFEFSTNALIVRLWREGKTGELR